MSAETLGEQERPRSILELTRLLYEEGVQPGHPRLMAFYDIVQLRSLEEVSKTRLRGIGLQELLLQGSRPPTYGDILRALVEERIATRTSEVPGYSDERMQLELLINRAGVEHSKPGVDGRPFVARTIKSLLDEKLNP